MADLPRLRRRFIFFLVLAIQSSIVERSRSEVYTVGDGEGWDSGVDYGVWSQKYNFSSGDVLGQLIAIRSRRSLMISDLAIVFNYM